MKRLAFIACCVLSVSCTHPSGKNAPDPAAYMATGTITGLDLGSCMTCGGYFINITGVGVTNFYYFPPGCNIDSTHFPINVRLNYTRNGSSGPIVITAMEKVN